MLFRIMQMDLLRQGIRHTINESALSFSLTQDFLLLMLKEMGLTLSIEYMPSRSR